MKAERERKKKTTLTESVPSGDAGFSHGLTQTGNFLGSSGGSSSSSSYLGQGCSQPLLLLAAPGSPGHSGRQRGHASPAGPRSGPEDWGGNGELGTGTGERGMGMGNGRDARGRPWLRLLHSCARGSRCAPSVRVSWGSRSGTALLLFLLFFSSSFSSFSPPFPLLSVLSRAFTGTCWEAF